MSAATAAFAFNALGLVVALALLARASSEWSMGNRSKLLQVLMAFGFVMVFLGGLITEAVAPFTVVGALFIGAWLAMTLRTLRKESR